MFPNIDIDLALVNSKKKKVYHYYIHSLCILQDKNLVSNTVDLLLKQIMVKSLKASYLA
jgi:hypothetical protein